MIKIGAWVYDPTKNIFGVKTGRSALYEAFCQDPNECDLYKSCGSCLLQGVGGCKFGRKSKTEGLTKHARSFQSWMSDRRKENEEYIGRLNPLKAFNRIFKAHGSYYMPYSHLDSSEFMSADSNPIKGKWVSESDMTPDLLGRICAYRPRSIFGGEITSYQKTEVVKFIWDLKKFYPDLFEALPEDQKERASAKGAIGRKADVTTLPPCSITISENKWEWDGEYLIGSYMPLQPVAGGIEIKIKPKKGEAVTIEREEQFSPEVEFVD